MPAHPRLLAGYTILDLSQYLSGPLCTTTLAALGAEVIKVEPPQGDGNRQLPPFLERGDAEEPQHNRSLVFLKRNQGKKSIVLDLKTPGGQNVLHRLIEKSDVLLHNFREGVAERVGADYASAVASNADLIYCSITGQLGSIGEVPSEDPPQPAGVIDVVGQALSGFLGSTGPQGGDPVRSRAPIADQTAGLYATISILAAIIERDVTNGGHGSRKVRVPMVESLAALLWDESLDAFQQQGMENRMGNISGRLCPYNTYRTRDDSFVTIAAASRGEWQRLNKAVQLPELDRPEWQEAANRSASRDTIDRILAAWAAEHDREDLIRALRAHGVTVGAVLDIDDMLSHDAYRESVLYSIEDDNFGVLHAPRFPVEIDDHRPTGPTGSVPRLGEDSVAVLRETTGLTSDEIDELLDSGAVRSASSTVRAEG